MSASHWNVLTKERPPAVAGLDPFSLLASAAQGAISNVVKDVQPAIQPAADAAKSALAQAQTTTEQALHAQKVKLASLKQSQAAMQAQINALRASQSKPLSKRVHDFVEDNAGTLAVVGGAVGIAAVAIKLAVGRKVL